MITVGLMVGSLAVGQQRSVTAAQDKTVSTAGATSQDRLSEDWWADRHAAVLQAVKAAPETPLLLLGDSITMNYEKSKRPDENFEPTWREFFGSRRALNLGFSGDTTENLLWRLQHGEIDGLHPKVAMVLIGTNDSRREGATVESTRAGIDAVVAELEGRLPGTRVLLLGILPTNLSEAKSKVDAGVNDSLARRYGGDARVTYLDIGSVFLKEDRIDSNLFYDPRLPEHAKPLHPDTQGQRLMAEAIEPTLSVLMADAPREPLRAMTEVNTALVPVAKLEPDSYDWNARHRSVMELQGAANPRLVLLGDSITHFWGGEPADRRQNGPASFEAAFHGIRVLNLGFGWDRTQNVLWRLAAGEFTGLKPKWVVLNIGTNNLVATEHARANTPDETADGVAAIVRLLRERSPESRVVVMGIFPRGAASTDPMRASIAATNQRLAAAVAGEPMVTFMNIGEQFLLPDGALPAVMMPDGTHPSEAGYTVWARALAKAGIKR